MRPATVLLMVLLLGASRCERADMVVQNKYRAYSPSSVWPDGAAARPIVAGTVDRGALARVEAAATPPPVDMALLARGRERYDIYCSPCHGLDGTGGGRVVERGFPSPPSYLSARLRAAPAKHIFAVITDGYGVMYPYADRVAPQDRWAIVAYVRALQLAGGEEPAPPRLGPMTGLTGGPVTEGPLSAVAPAAPVPTGDAVGGAPDRPEAGP